MDARAVDSADEPPSFEGLVSQYQDKIVRLAYSILGNRALADESAQEIFVRIWRALPGFRGQSAISTWIYAIARNHCLTVLKRGDAGLTVSLEERGIRNRAESPAVAMVRGPESPDIQLALSRLPAKYRQVLTLFYMEERSYDDVAQLLDLPIGTVKTWLYRAKKEMAATLMEANIREGVR